MRPTLALCLAFFALVPQRQCDLRPDKLNSQIAGGLEPYFANARVEAIPKQGVIVGYTCIFGAGPDLPAKIAQAIVNDQDVMGKLNLIQWFGPLATGVNYNFVVLGFDNGVIRYNTHTHEVAIMPPPDGYAAKYRDVCVVPSQ